MDAALMTFDLTRSDPLGVNSVTFSTIPFTFDPTLWLCLLPPGCSMEDDDEEDEALM